MPDTLTVSQVRERFAEVTGRVQVLILTAAPRRDVCERLRRRLG